MIAKDLIKALQLIDENTEIYTEGGFNDTDIGVIFDVVVQENGVVKLLVDGHCSDDDKPNTIFDFSFKERSLLNDKRY